ncbi:MAG: putative metalloprotease CJM1_0395 family protein [Candidatus Hydrogenedentales bacterium]|jgi:hypothetical protein
MAVRPIGEDVSPFLRAQNRDAATQGVRRDGTAPTTNSPPSTGTTQETDGVAVDFSAGALEAAGRAANADDTPKDARPSIAGQEEPTPEEKQQIAELKQRDAEVRRHEQAHLSAAGGYARGGANFSYTTGPDGKRYATRGEVSMDVGAERTPEATLAKMAVVKRAAVAPANPSSQDRAVYAQAARTEAQARQAATEASFEETRGSGKETAATEGDQGKPEAKGFSLLA